MPYPHRCSIEIDGMEVHAASAHVGLKAPRDEHGQPEIGVLETSIGVCLDLHDRRNVDFGTVARLFELANRATQDKIVDVSVRLWDDEDHTDVVAQFNFRGWICEWRADTPKRYTEAGEQNHELYLELQPELDPDQLHRIVISN